MHGPQLTPQILLPAYAEGLFPMAERRGDPTLYWVSRKCAASSRSTGSMCRIAWRALDDHAYLDRTRP